MKRLCSAFWLPLLVVLLGGSSVASGPDRAWSEAGVVLGAPTERAPDGYVRSAAEWRHTLDARLRKDRSSHPHAGLLPAALAATAYTPPLCSLRHRDHDAVPGQACHYPLFPTGPPWHS